MELLLEKGANPHYLNNKDLNCFDYAILNCNYNIGYSLLNKTNLKIRDKEEYLKLMKYEKTPFFNFPLFYEALENNVSPERVPFFFLTNQQKKSTFSFKIQDLKEKILMRHL